MSKWSEAKVTAVHPAAEGLTSLELDLRGTPLAGTHRQPGQYVSLSLEGVGTGLFAIASAPHADARFEFLIKRGSPLSDALRLLQPGSKVRVSLPAGQGFPIAKAEGKNLLLFATGSGISSIRSVIHFVRQDRSDYGRISLYFGARTPNSFAYERELETWQREGIQVFRIVSQPGESGWKGLTGYIQSHLGELNVDNAVAFLSGQPAMVEEVTRALMQRGLPRQNIYLNF
jgi:NAD(P)H-flavin reductase